MELGKVGVVVVGYPGVGKSTLAEKYLQFVDLESNSFKLADEHVDDWEVIYCQAAEHIATEGRIVFISSHKMVRDYLLSLPQYNDVKIMAVVPSQELKFEWIEKLKERFEDSELSKDWYAYTRARDHYFYDVNCIKEEFEAREYPVLEITSMEYDLKGLLDQFILEKFGLSF